MSRDSSQKFVAKNRPPRVQIEYETETYGGPEKVSLPFVMGVMSDLSGQKKELPPVSERKFLEIDMDNFSQRMNSINPEASFRVKNTLTGEGELSVSLNFKNMDDFNPEKVAENVPEINTLLQARKRLANLLAYADGKSDAQDLLNDLMQQPEFLQQLSSAGSASDSSAQDLDEQGPKEEK